MSQQYSYHQDPAAPQRLPANHGTSSAFSPSANPDEDWTQISDLAVRRRIQNRIAQRKYRKKLKRRLEDLERRAGSSSASPPQSHTELNPSKPTTNMHKTPSSSSRATKLSRRATYQNPHQYLPSLSKYAFYPAPDSSFYTHDTTTTTAIPSVYSYPPAAPTQWHSYNQNATGDKDLNPFDMSYSAMVGLDFQHAFDDPLVSPR